MTILLPSPTILQPLFNLQGIVSHIHCRSMWSLAGPVQNISIIYEYAALSVEEYNCKFQHCCIISRDYRVAIIAGNPCNAGCRSCQALIDHEVGTRADDAALHHKTIKSIHAYIFIHLIHSLLMGYNHPFVLKYSILSFNPPPQLTLHLSIHPKKTNKLPLISTMTALLQRWAPVKSR